MSNAPAVYDVIIIGAGPAGLSAALYASRARLKTFVFESSSAISQVLMTDIIENYPGFPEGINGFDLVMKLKTQAEKFGSEITSAGVKSIESLKNGSEKIFRVKTDENDYQGLSVIIASGAKPKILGIPGEMRLTGKGVSYCAVCDAAFFRGMDVAVVGGGDTAAEEALFLSKFCKSVKMIHRRDALRAAKILQERLFSHKNIEIIWDSVVSEISGESKVESLKLRNVKTNAESVLSCSGVFIFAGYSPNTDFLGSLVKMNGSGYIITDAGMRTSEEGIFACGDCCEKPLRQIVTACSDGAVAGVSVNSYLER